MKNFIVFLLCLFVIIGCKSSDSKVETIVDAINGNMEKPSEPIEKPKEPVVDIKQPPLEPEQKEPVEVVKETVEPTESKPSVEVDNSQSGRLVTAHNEWRADVGVIPLVWNQDIADAAQKWADKLHSEGKIYHDPNRGSVGENVAMGFRSPEDAVSAWGAEIQNYNYETNGCNGVCGHYTQIVWHSTIEVGCGQAGSVWVCRYYPPGNYVGQKPY